MDGIVWDGLLPDVRPHSLVRVPVDPLQVTGPLWLVRHPDLTVYPTVLLPPDGFGGVLAVVAGSPVSRRTVLIGDDPDAPGWVQDTAGMTVGERVWAWRSLSPLLDATVTSVVPPRTVTVALA